MKPRRSGPAPEQLGPAALDAVASKAADAVAVAPAVAVAFAVVVVVDFAAAAAAAERVVVVVAAAAFERSEVAAGVPVAEVDLAAEDLAAAA